MPIPKKNLNRLGIAAFPGDVAGMMPIASYAVLGATLAAGLDEGFVVMVLGTDTENAAESWQLREWTKGTAPVTNAVNGIIKPADYDAATNKRAWFRAS